MHEFLIGIRDGAADRATIEAAGLTVTNETFGGRAGESKPLRNYVRASAKDEATARVEVIQRLGWDPASVELADIVVHSP